MSTPTTDIEPASVLNAEQQQRAAAVMVARRALSTQTGLVGSKAPAVTDLHAIASYVVTGEDPWATPDEPVTYGEATS